MKRILFTILLLSLGKFSGAQTVQYDSVINLYFAEINPIILNTGESIDTLSRVYIRRPTDTTVDIFFRYLVYPGGTSYQSLIRVYGYTTGKIGTDYLVFRYISDNLELPVHGFISSEINITYR